MSEGEKRGSLLARFFPGAEDVPLLSALAGHGGQTLESRDGQSALVISRGFVYLGGQVNERFFQAASAHFPPCFLTFCGSPGWLRAAAAWGADVPMTRFRLDASAAFDRGRLLALAEPPAGYRLKTGDEETWRDCRKAAWSEDLVSLYEDPAEFARAGLMIAAYDKTGALAAGCGAYARTDAAAEIEIDTHPDHRRRGLARCCGAAFLLLCMEKGVTPHWDAMTEISRDLALRFGFEHPRPYSVVCREETAMMAR